MNNGLLLIALASLLTFIGCKSDQTSTMANKVSINTNDNTKLAGSGIEDISSHFRTDSTQSWPEKTGRLMHFHNANVERMYLSKKGPAFNANYNSNDVIAIIGTKTRNNVVFSVEEINTQVKPIQIKVSSKEVSQLSVEYRPAYVLSLPKTMCDSIPQVTLNGKTLEYISMQ